MFFGLARTGSDVVASPHANDIVFSSFIARCLMQFVANDIDLPIS